MPAAAGVSDKASQRNCIDAWLVANEKVLDGAFDSSHWTAPIVLRYGAQQADAMVRENAQLGSANPWTAYDRDLAQIPLDVPFDLALCGPKISPQWLTCG